MKFLHFWGKKDPSEERTVLFSEGFHLMSVLIHPNSFIPDTFPQTAFSTAYVTSHTAAYFFR